MTPEYYDFKIGDLVITTYGELGHIIDICECAECNKRGFHEPTWMDLYGRHHYITDYDASCGFKDFYRIGEYRFNRNFDKPEVVQMIKNAEKTVNELRKQLHVIELAEKGVFLV